MSLFSWLGSAELHGLERSFAVIVVSEIGDKTFLIAAILAMRHSRTTVFAGAFFALALMSLLSALLGHVLPHLLPRRYTTIAAALLFYVFGARMLREGWRMEAGTGQIEEEMREVQKEVEHVATGPDLELGTTTTMLSSNETGGASTTPRPGSSRAVSPRPLSPVPGKRRTSEPALPSAVTGFKRLPHTALEGIRNLSLFLFSPILVQAFVLTFLAEWGDRSQITTIALAAAHNVFIVTIGTIAGHSVCTIGAVLGGRWLATKISIKNVTLGGAILFLLFGTVYSYEALYWSEADLAAAADTIGVMRR